MWASAAGCSCHVVASNASRSVDRHESSPVGVDDVLAREVKRHKPRGPTTIVVDRQSPPGHGSAAVRGKHSDSEDVVPTGGIVDGCPAGAARTSGTAARAGPIPRYAGQTGGRLKMKGIRALERPIERCATGAGGCAAELSASDCAQRQRSHKDCGDREHSAGHSYYHFGSS
jgi:hypothetical protein